MHVDNYSNTDSFSAPFVRGPVSSVWTLRRGRPLVHAIPLVNEIVKELLEGLVLRLVVRRVRGRR